jgi:hypothetical protein
MKQLWGLTRTATPGERMTNGLSYHLRVSELMTVLMKVGDQVQSYVLLDGCKGCRSGRCETGCRTDLLRRSLENDSALRQVIHGLQPRPYTRRVLAWPGKSAQPLSVTLLNEWEEARLTIHYHPWPFGKGKIAAVALLLVGEGETNPKAVLREQGWNAVALPLWLPFYQPKAVPQSLPFGQPYPHPPLLLFPDGQEIALLAAVASNGASAEPMPETLDSDDEPEIASTNWLDGASEPASEQKSAPDDGFSSEPADAPENEEIADGFADEPEPESEPASEPETDGFADEPESTSKPENEEIADGFADEPESDPDGEPETDGFADEPESDPDGEPETDSFADEPESDPDGEPETDGFADDPFAVVFAGSDDDEEAESEEFTVTDDAEVPAAPPAPPAPPAPLPAPSALPDGDPFASAFAAGKEPLPGEAPEEQPTSDPFAAALSALQQQRSNEGE